MSRFRYIAAAEPPTISMATPPISRDGSQASMHSAQSVLPWYPAAGVQPTGYYHATTDLPSNVPGLLVDIGAFTNLGGSKRGRTLAQAAINAGYKPSQSQMSRPLHIQGVGSGTQQCNWECNIPIACPVGDGTTAQLFHYQAPLVEGSGEDLPLIVGLKSIEGKRGVIETDPEGRRMTLPGPGGYKIVWSPGSVHLPLTPAPSGYLIIACSAYSRVVPSTGVPTPVKTLHATTAPAVSPVSPEYAAASSGHWPQSPSPAENSELESEVPYRTQAAASPRVNSGLVPEVPGWMSVAAPSPTSPTQPFFPVGAEGGIPFMQPSISPER